MTVRLGIDLGEIDDEPEALYAAAHLAYIAAGAHAGDASSIRRAVERCIANGVQIGAHPGFDDRARFGRVDLLDVTATELRESVFAQCARVRSAAERYSAEVRVLKLHGALYHRADRDESMARAALEGARAALGEGLVIVAWPERTTARIAAVLGFSVLREGFADRGVRADRTLIARGEPGAIITDVGEAVERARQLVAAAETDVLCVHGDNTNSVAIARGVRAWIDSLGDDE